VQVRLLTMNDEVNVYAQEVAAGMRKQGIRVKVEGGASMMKLIRNASTAKTPVMCVVGKQASHTHTHTHTDTHTDTHTHTHMLTWMLAWP